MQKFRLSNGMEIPAIGFGCYNAKGGDNLQIIKDAIDSGYTLFDTASLYGTERALGQAIKEKGVPRESLTIQSKLWLDEMGADNAKAAVVRSLERLQMDYIDIYMIHWPRQNGSTGDEWKALLTETYQALEEMVDLGVIMAIGLSNFLPHHLDHILSICRIKPVVNQLEYHIGYTQDYAVNYSKEKGLLVQAWSPLGRGSIFEDAEIKKMAGDKSVSQLALRFVYQSGVLPLPKATAPERQKQNLDIFDFEISKEDFHTLASRPSVMWSGEHPDLVIPTAVSNFNQ